MEALEGYFIFAMYLSLAMGVMAAICSEHTREMTLGAVGIVALVSLISPLSSVVRELGSVPDFGDSESLPTGAFDDAIESAFSEGIRSYLSSEWGIEASDTEARVEDFSSSDMRAGELTVTLSGKGALADVRSIKEALTESFVREGGICKVVISLE